LTFKNINPSLFDLDGIGSTCGVYDETEQFVYPTVLQLSSKGLEHTKWCLLDDGFNLYLYILELSN
jgi:hypothetical protein